MKKLFISQPMRGKSDEEILKEREKAIKSAEKQMDEPVEVIDSFFQSAPTDARPLWYLGESLKLLATADVAYFAKEEFLRLCKAKVAEYTNAHMDITDKQQVNVNDVYVVWSCKTLQNSKALLSTTVPDGMYYELTYNGDKNELYMDAYKKFENRCFKM